jgi:hypothetical protein
LLSTGAGKIVFGIEPVLTDRVSIVIGFVILWMLRTIQEHYRRTTVEWKSEASSAGVQRLIALWDSERVRSVNCHRNPNSFRFGTARCPGALRGRGRVRPIDWLASGGFLAIADLGQARPNYIALYGWRDCVVRLARTALAPTF